MKDIGCGLYAARASWLGFDGSHQSHCSKRVGKQYCQIQASIVSPTSPRVVGTLNIYIYNKIPPFVHTTRAWSIDFFCYSPGKCGTRTLNVTVPDVEPPTQLSGVT